MWTKGLFALKPLKLSCDLKKLTVQFFWQVPGNFNAESKVDLLTEPTPSEGLDLVANGHFLNRLENDGSTPRIRSGDTFTFTTEDPKTLPLPSVELLEMQWILQRLVGMCGAAGWPILEYEYDAFSDDNGSLIAYYTNGNVHNSLERVCEWVNGGEATGTTPGISTDTPDLSVIECH